MVGFWLKLGNNNDNHCSAKHRKVVSLNIYVNTQKNNDQNCDATFSLPFQKETLKRWRERERANEKNTNSKLIKCNNIIGNLWWNRIKWDCVTNDNDDGIGDWHRTKPNTKLTMCIHEEEKYQANNFNAYTHLRAGKSMEMGCLRVIYGWIVCGKRHWGWHMDEKLCFNFFIIKFSTMEIK